MAQTATLSATIRQSTGKGAARSLRRQGKVPGVIYGHGRAAEPVVVDTLALTKMLIGISAATTIVDVAIEGRPGVRALIREIQRDALRPGDIIHLDLYEIQADEAITLEVPVRLIGVPAAARTSAAGPVPSLRSPRSGAFRPATPSHITPTAPPRPIGPPPSFAA